MSSIFCLIVQLLIAGTHLGGGGGVAARQILSWDKDPLNANRSLFALLADHYQPMVTEGRGGTG